MSQQISIFDNIYVDSFAGGGGASTGIELATGRPIDIAINHDESAILMHRCNHPYTEHYREDIWQVDPIEATRGRHVRLAWFSPDCKHFSRAKGAALVDKNIRGLAWVVLRWAGVVRPDVIMLENVPEFVTWCPVRKGKPVKKKKGETYRKWYNQLRALGYKIDTRELCAADYGAPTIRKRFCLVARCDGKPIVFPERTHAPRDSAEVKSGKYKPWRAAAEVIDWSLPCYSIFEDKEIIKEKYGARVNRPLKPNTLRRITRGLDKFVLKSAEPFIVPIGYGERLKQAPRVNDIKEPLSTVVSTTKQYVCVPSLIQYHSEQTGERVRGQSLKEPLMTVDGSNRYGLVTTDLTPCFSDECHYHSFKKPLATITTMEREGVTAAFISEYYGTARDGLNLNEPVQTLTAKDREGVIAAFMSKFYSGVIGSEIKKPLPTVTAVDHNGLIKATLVKYENGQNLGYWNEIRALLNKYAGYNIADDEVLLLNIRGTWYYISDIGLRMLTPRELYDAMGFPHDYIIDRDIAGNRITRTAKVARCGNAVCPPLATALVRANLPEECTAEKYNEMNALYKAMVS
jgi:DNA (cytosine-5)-methyltransferase 1